MGFVKRPEELARIQHALSHPRFVDTIGLPAGSSYRDTMLLASGWRFYYRNITRTEVNRIARSACAL